MKQSTRLISERRVRAAIFAAYDEQNPDNKPREIAVSVIDALDSIVMQLIYELVRQEDCSSGRLKNTGYFITEYWACAK